MVRACSTPSLASTGHLYLQDLRPIRAAWAAGGFSMGARGQGGWERVVWVSCESTAHAWSSRSGRGDSVCSGDWESITQWGGFGTSAPDVVLPMGEEHSLEDAGSVRYLEGTLQAQEQQPWKLNMRHGQGWPCLALACSGHCLKQGWAQILACLCPAAVKTACR